MKLIDWSPGELESLHAHFGTTVPKVPTVLFADDTPSFGETFVAAWSRENLTYELFRQLNVAETYEGSIGAEMGLFEERKLVEVDPSWNPYSYIRTAWSEERRKELEFEIRGGLFENLKTPEQVDAFAAKLSREKLLIKTMQEGPGLATILGTLGAAATDLTTFIPLAGPINRIRGLGRISKAVLLGSTAAAVPELGLQALQELRTAQESFLNIAAGAAIGGGLGAFAKVLDARHPLHPRNPDNPLRPENLDKQGVGVRTPEGDMEVIEPRDLSAAASPINAPKALPGVTSGIPVIGKLAERITGATPAGRALQYQGEKSRELLVRMMDLGGVLTDTNRYGVKLGHSAEDLKRDLLVLRDRLFLFGEKQLRDLNYELGQSDLARSFGFRGVIDEVRFSEVARRKLLNEWTEQDAEALAREFGPEAAKLIEAHAANFAERIHKTNAEFERELIELGKLKPEESLGRDYGHAQLWDPHSIMARQEEFEDFLYGVLIDRPDPDWLLSRYGLKPDDFDKLGREDVPSPQLKPGEVQPRTLSVEEGEALKREVLREWAGDEHVFNINRAETRAKAAEQALKQAELDLTDTLRAYRFVKGETHRLEVAEARKYRDQFLTRLETERARRAQLQAEERVLIAAAEAARTRTLERNLLHLEPGQTAKEPPRTPDIAAATAKAQTIANELRRVETRVRRMEAALARVEAAYKVAQERLAMARKARDGIQEAAKDARKARRIAEADLAKLKRALAKTEAKTPLAQVVEEIANKLINRNELPHAIIDRIVPETGRVKARRIRLTPEQRRKAEELGFLRTDLSAILSAQYEQLAGYIGLSKGLDIRPGGRFGSWEDVLRVVDEEYARLPNAKPGERQRVKKDLNLLKDRLLGMENVGADKDGWAYWLSAKVRQANFIRFGAGFLLPSLTDIASVHLRTGSLAKLLRSHGAEAVSIMKRMYEESPSEFVAMVNATELGANGVRMARALDADDALNLMGIGAHGSFKHTFTANVDRGMRWLSDKTSLVSGMRIWNRFWKITAGIQRAYRIRDMVGDYAALTERQKAELANLGIDAAAAKRIHDMISRYGKTDVKGHFDPNLDEWTATPQGREAARDFRIAVERDMNRAIFTPGIGDVPGIMSHAAGKMWLQFQTYAFAFLNRFLVPASQRVATWRDAQSLVSFGHLAWTGLIVVLGKDIINGRDPAKRFEEGEWANTVKEVIDRSGMMTFLSPYVDSLLKVSGPLQEQAFGEVKIGPTSRYSRNSWSDSLLGASFGLYRDLRSFGSALSETDLEQSTKKGLVLAPWNFYWRLMHQLADPA